MRLRRHIRHVLRAVAIAATITACTLGGMAVGLFAASGDRQTTEFGTLETRVLPDFNGHVSVYVPLVDWRVRLLEHDAPVRIELELRGIDRDRAGRGISSASAATRSLAEVRADSTRVLEQAIRRAVLVAVVGGLAGGLVAGALITSTRLRRKWLLLAPVFGALVVAGFVVPSVAKLDRLDPGELQVTTSGANARELPAVLRFAEQLLEVGDEYEQHYETALRSITNVAMLADRDRRVPDERAFVISDFHDNVFVLDAFDEFAGDSTVYAVGDFISVGATVEQRHAPLVAALGGRMVAVSGNHDTPEYMSALAGGGATVLDADSPMTKVGDLLVVGYPDPLERDIDSDGEHRLRVYGEEYEAQRDEVSEWWDGLSRRPDVVLIHQHGFAHHLVEHLEATGDDRPLLVLTGHDHKPHVHVDGPRTVVDAGTIGAGGVTAVGEQAASFAQLDLVDGRVVAVVMVDVEPVTGRATSERIDLR